MKRFMSILLVFAMIISFVPAMTTEAKAITENEVSAQLTQMMNQWVGKQWTNHAYFSLGKECYEFAHFVFNTIFGRSKTVIGSGASSTNSTCYKFNNVASDVITIGTLEPGYSWQAMETLLESAKPGDFLQTKKGGINPHSMIVVSVNAAENYIEVFDANASDTYNLIRKRKITFDTFKSRKNGATLYRHNSYSDYCDAVLSINRDRFSPNEAITFTFGGHNNGLYTLGVYRDNVRIDTVTVEGSTYTARYSGTGNYSAYMTAYSNGGDYADSNWVYWQINDLSATLAINEEKYDKGGSVVFTIGGNNCLTYSDGPCTLGIFREGVLIDTVTLYDEVYIRAFDEAGEYSAYVTAYSDNDYVDSSWVYWKVVEYPSPPQLLISNSLYDEGSNIEFEWTNCAKTDYYDFWVYKNGEAVYNKLNIEELGHQIQLPEGQYTARVASVNEKYGTWTWSNEVSFAVERRWGAIEGLDIGSDFYACIINTSQWRYVTNDSANVSLRSGTGEENQIWRFVYQGDGYYKIYSCSDGNALDVYGAYTESGTNVHVYPDHESDAQLWMLTGKSNGDITIAPKCSACVLDVDGGSENLYEGVNIQIWTRNGTDAQLFHIWTDLSKTISYNANGGTNTPPEQSGQYMSTVKLSTEIPTKTGFTFLGWATSADSTRAAYQPGDSLTIRGNVKEKITLYAVWEEGCSGEHSYSYKVSVTPTQSGEGAIIGECKNCPNTVKVPLPKLNTTDYTYDVRKASTCTTDGSGRYTWKDTTYGTYYFDVTIPQKGHIVETDAAVPATCTKTGLTEGKHCSVCGTVLVAQKETSALGHSYSAWAESKSATCIAKGQEQRDCTRCDHFETRETAALGHAYSEKVTAPTCTAKGYTTYTCTRCSHSYTGNEKAALGHAWDSGKVTTEPTEESGGIRTYTCTRCGETRNEAIPPKDHVHSYTAVITKPTCTEQGYTTYTCTCGDSYQADKTAALGHDYEAEVTEPTCTEIGYTTYTCIRCSDSYTGSEKAALGHAWGEGVETVKPTQTESGIRTYTCTRCEETKAESIPPLSHKHSFAEQVTPPTCTEAGYTTYICACGESYKDTYTDALKHSYTDGLCVRCGAKDPDYVDPKPGHICPSENFTDVPAFGDWSHNGIDYCVEHELMNGTGNGLFNPNGTVSRAQLVTILYRVAGSPTVTTSGTFTDVPAGQWYSNTIEWAAANGVVNGIGNGKFGPDQSITREQIATILYRYENQPAVSGDLNSFPDQGSVSGFAVTGLIWATQEGLITGVSSNGTTTLAPKNNATRAQIASIIMRYLDS